MDTQKGEPGVERMPQLSGRPALVDLILWGKRLQCGLLGPEPRRLDSVALGPGPDVFIFYQYSRGCRSTGGPWTSL